MPLRFKLKYFQKLTDLISGFLNSIDTGLKLKMLRNTEITKQSGVIGDIGRPPLDFQRCAVKRKTIDNKVPRSTRNNSTQSPHGSRFSGAIPSDQTKYLAGLDRNRQIIHSESRVIDFRGIFNLNQNTLLSD